jgi:hypothetical protein
MMMKLKLAGARPAVIAALALGVAVAVASCGDPPPPAPVKKENVPQWADAFQAPEIYGVVRVQALKRDGVYGAFWKSLLRVAQARGLTRGTTMAEVVEGVDEIIVGLNHGDDAALVLRNVPASADATKINDANGQPLFRAVNEQTKVPELELRDRRIPETGSLFVLPDRTWVGTLGEARGRARQAFATPVNRPAPSIPEDSLVALRFAGPIVHVLDRHPVWGPITKKLQTATFMLKRGKGGLVVAFDYLDADATAWAEMQVKRVAQEMTKDEKRYGWLKDAKVQYEGNTVFLRVAVPPRLLEELPNATGADLPF